MTIDGVNSYLDFDTNLNHLTDDLLIVTQVFNRRLKLDANTYTCFVVEKWFRTDGASIPFLTRPIAMLSPRSKAIFRPAIWHDKLYKDQSIKIYEFDSVNRVQWQKLWELKVSRLEADYFIVENMDDMWATFWNKLATFIWLRIGGWYCWSQAKRILKK